MCVLYKDIVFVLNVFPTSVKLKKINFQQPKFKFTKKFKCVNKKKLKDKTKL